jgi:hypothetical protein
MDTPVKPERGFVPALYGECASRINHGIAVIGRRALIAGALALPVAARAGPKADLLNRVLKASGGREKLARVRAMNWTGTATVNAGDKTLQIQVKTRVEPFVRARSESFLAGKPETVRTLIIEPDGGYVERGGKRTPLPARQTDHERQQYGVYGYMLLGQAPARVEGNRIVSQRPGLPPISFLTEGDYLAAADYTVDDPETDGTIAQRFIFEGEYGDLGIHWPQTVTIFHNDKLYFMLDLQSFSVEFA